VHEPIDPDAELNEVRNQIATSNTDVFPPGIVAEIDNERAWLHDELRQRGLDPESPEFERTWLVGGAVIARLIASPNTTRLLANIENDNHRAHLASLLFWCPGISPHHVETMR
jgi:hypothetical protein